MKSLEIDSYYKLIEPLKKVTINNLFARSVVEQHVSGKVYVDNHDNPKTYYVIHPYGMSLLFGNCENNEFNEHFKRYALNLENNRNKIEWMQAFSVEWNLVLQEIFKSHLVKSGNHEAVINNKVIELNTRINFKFNLEKYKEFKKNNITKNLKIVRTDKEMFLSMKGSVVPSNFWDNEEDFDKNGIGFSLFHKNKLATTAYSAFLHDNKLELGMETIDEFRGKGFAQYACSKLIDYCIENNYEPIWACRLENTGSYKLAEKLGFEAEIEIPYYKLGV